MVAIADKVVFLLLALSPEHDRRPEIGSLGDDPFLKVLLYPDTEFLEPPEISVNLRPFFKTVNPFPLFPDANHPDANHLT
jgi:hypothetical protein